MYADRVLDEDHARRIISMRNNGGWKLKAKTRARSSKSTEAKTDDAKNAATNQGDRVRGEEPDEDQAGS